MSGATRLPQRVETVRRFNQFYSRHIHDFDAGCRRYNLTPNAARVICELAVRQRATATSLSRELGIDLDQVGRITRDLHKRELLRKKISAADNRHNLLELTDDGIRTYARLTALAHNQSAGLLGRLADGDQHRLLAAMKHIEDLLGARTSLNSSVLLRPHQPGDMGWIVERHAALFSQEFGWGSDFESEVATTVARFIRVFDVCRERCWIAEKEGERVGCVMVVKRTKSIAELQLLLVDPLARGIGLGGRLVGECSRFAELAGYEKLSLQTWSVQDPARRLWEEEGFELAKETEEIRYGHVMVRQRWDLVL